MQEVNNNSVYSCRQKQFTVTANFAFFDLAERQEKITEMNRPLYSDDQSYFYASS